MKGGFGRWMACGLAVFAGSLSAAAPLTSACEAKPFAPGPDPFWPAAISAVARTRLGVPPDGAKAIDEFVALCRDSGADTCLIVWHDHIVAEWFSADYHGESLNIASSTKSITGLLACVLQAEGKVGYKDPVGKYLPSWKDGGWRGRVAIDDLLTMTSGITHEFDMDDEFMDNMLLDFNRYVVKRMEPSEVPGLYFNYANYAAQLLSPILDKVAGEPLHRFARKKLFDPLSIAPDSGYLTDPAGGTVDFMGAHFRPREFARIGALVLHGGTWEGRQIVPASTCADVAVGNPEGNPNYGRLWWVLKNPNGLEMLGSGHNDCYIYPAADLVVVRQQARQRPVRREYESFVAPTLASLVAALSDPPKEIRK